MRAVSTIVGATAAAFLFSGVAAQAATEVYIFTGSSQACTDAGTNAVANGLAASYRCRSGVAGWDLLLTPKAGVVTNKYVYTFGSSSECTSAGANGVAGGVFTSYTCQPGVAGWSLSATG